MGIPQTGPMLAQTEAREKAELTLTCKSLDDLHLLVAHVSENVLPKLDDKTIKQRATTRYGVYKIEVKEAKR